MPSKQLIGGAAVAAAVGTLGLVGSAAAAPPDLPGENPNKNAIVVPVTCEGVNDGLPFLVWLPNTKGFENGEAASVGHPVGADAHIGVQKVERQGAAFDRAVACETPIGPVRIMPTGQDRR